MKTSRLPALLFTALTGFACLAAFPSHAQSPRGFYGGGGLGLANISAAENSDFYYYYLPEYQTGEDDTATELHFGYRFSEHVATEAVYFRTSPEWDDAFVYVPELNDSFNVFADTDIDALQLSVVGIWPFASIWEFYVKGGLANWDGTADQRLLRISDSVVFSRTVEDSSTDIFFGLGVGASPKPSFHLRIEFQTFGIDRDLVNAQGDTTVDTIMVGFDFRPGRRE